ncbi:MULTISPECIES: DUF4352 domain-containing protein [Listeria]|uniref:DUF4352 domain-containing protein n=1 Tax=Listeria TaxID=1637 RepID=UPI000B58B5AC|nr:MULTISPECIES: DUF4352 domain-containing protein [Listeria]
MKKRNKWYLFIIVVSVVLIGFGGYWAFNFKEEATSAVVDNMKVQVLSQETTDQVGTSEWKKKATGTFLILDAEMTNQANKEQPASLLTFKIKDTKTKKEYPLSESATISNALNKDGKMKDVFFLSTLAKGESKEGQLVFEMPAKAAKADSLELVISSTKTAQQKSIKIQN